MKKKILFGLAIVLAIIFIAMPLPSDGVTLRLYFDEFEEGDMVLYYSTAEVPVMTQENSVAGVYDEYRKVMTFRIPRDVSDSVLGIRIDFPENSGQLLSVRDVTVSSGGVVRKRYLPDRFFAAANLAVVNDIPAQSDMTAKQMMYFQLGESDPYVELQAGFAAELMACRSKYRLTRFVIVVLVFAAWWFGRKKYFPDEVNE